MKSRLRTKKYNAVTSPGQGQNGRVCYGLPDNEQIIEHFLQKLMYHGHLNKINYREKLIVQVSQFLEVCIYIILKKSELTLQAPGNEVTW